MGKILADAGLTLRAKVLSDGKPVPLAETVFWRKGDKITMGLIKNPTRRGSISGAGEIHDVTGEPIEVEIILHKPAANIRNLRTGETLPDGDSIKTRWKPWEGLLFQYEQTDF
jgi:hypothetical protein